MLISYPQIILQTDCSYGESDNGSRNPSWILFLQNNFQDTESQQLNRTALPLPRRLHPAPGSTMSPTRPENRNIRRLRPHPSPGCWTDSRPSEELDRKMGLGPPRRHRSTQTSMTTLGTIGNKLFVIWFVRELIFRLNLFERGAELP